jgi:hypothetical protein
MKPTKLYISPLYRNFAAPFFTNYYFYLKPLVPTPIKLPAQRELKHLVQEHPYLAITGSDPQILPSNLSLCYLEAS